jgi:hypothetical protein
LPFDDSSGKHFVRFHFNQSGHGGAHLSSQLCGRLLPPYNRKKKGKDWFCVEGRWSWRKKKVFRKDKM